MPLRDMKYGIPDLTLEAIRNVIRQHKGVTRVILYGSRAKGTYRNGSDIDITLEGETLSFGDLKMKGKRICIP